MINQLRLVHYLILNFLAQKKKVRAKEVLTELQTNGIRINMHKLYTLIDRLEQQQLIESSLTNTTPPIKELKILPAAEAFISQIQRMLGNQQESSRTSDKPVPALITHFDDPIQRQRVSIELSKLLKTVFFKDLDTFSPSDSRNIETIVNGMVGIIKNEVIKLREVPLKNLPDKDRKKLK